MESPKHYKDTKLMDLLIEKKVPFSEGNVIKYVFRWREKDGIKDLYKARDYLNALIAHEEAQTACSPATFPELHNRREADKVALNPDFLEKLKCTSGVTVVNPLNTLPNQPY